MLGRTRRVLVPSALIAAATLTGGCIFVHDSERVYTSDPITHSQMTDMVSRTRDLRVGMPRADALALYPAEHLNLKSSTTSGGGVIEEWQVQAYSNRGDVHFRRYLYFTNDRLSAFSDDRIDYRDNPEVVRSWTGM